MSATNGTNPLRAALTRSVQVSRCVAIEALYPDPEQEAAATALYGRLEKMTERDDATVATEMIEQAAPLIVAIEATDARTGEKIEATTEQLVAMVCADYEEASRIWGAVFRRVVRERLRAAMVGGSPLAGTRRGKAQSR